MNRIKLFGPVYYRHLKDKKYKKHFIDVWVGDGWGWSWGEDGADHHRDGVLIRLFKFDVLRIEMWPSGFHIAVLGFWWIK